MLLSSTGSWRKRLYQVDVGRQGLLSRVGGIISASFNLSLCLKSTSMQLLFPIDRTTPPNRAAIVVEFGTMFDSNKVPEMINLVLLQDKWVGLPWWLGGKESSCQSRRHRFKSWSGKTPHAAEQLSPWATTTEPVLYGPGSRNYWAPEPRARALRREQPAQTEACTPHLESSPRSLQLETARAAMKTQHSQ